MLRALLGRRRTRVWRGAIPIRKDAIPRGCNSMFCITRSHTFRTIKYINLRVYLVESN